jgi:hypothetical protein
MIDTMVNTMGVLDKTMVSDNSRVTRVVNKAETRILDINNPLLRIILFNGRTYSLTKTRVSNVTLMMNNSSSLA